MAIDPFTKAGSGLGAGYSKSDYDYAFYSAKSGLVKGTLADHKAAYYRSRLGLTGDFDYLRQQFNASGIGAFRSNLALDPSCFFWVEMSGWSGGGTGNLTQQATTGMPLPTSWKQTWTSNSTDFWGGLGQSNHIAVVPGVTYTGSLYYRQSRANYVYCELKWYDSALSVLRVEGFPAVSVPVNTVTRLSGTFTAPANAAWLQMWAVTNAGTSWVIGDFMEVTGLLIEPSGTLNSYFAGSSTGCSWSGAANASTSTGYPEVGRLLTDTFTGNSGEAWAPRWSSPDSGKATIQANKGRVTTGTSATYQPRREYNNSFSLGNTDLSGTFTTSAAGIEQYVALSINSDGSTPGHDLTWTASNCYSVFCSLYATPTSSTLGVSQIVGGVETKFLSAVPTTLTGGVTYGFRFQRVGQVLNFRIWDTAGAEPVTWNLTYTLTGTPMIGGIILCAASGASSSAVVVDFDNIVVSTLP